MEKPPLKGSCFQSVWKQCTIQGSSISEKPYCLDWQSAPSYFPSFNHNFARTDVTNHLEHQAAGFVFPSRKFVHIQRTQGRTSLSLALELKPSLTHSTRIQKAGQRELETSCNIICLLEFAYDSCLNLHCAAVSHRILCCVEFQLDPASVESSLRYSLATSDLFGVVQQSRLFSIPLTWLLCTSVSLFVCYLQILGTFEMLSSNSLLSGQVCGSCLNKSHSVIHVKIYSPA